MWTFSFNGNEILATFYKYFCFFATEIDEVLSNGIVKVVFNTFNLLQARVFHFHVSVLKFCFINILLIRKCYPAGC